MDLVDDLADVMARIVVGWKEQTGIDLAEYHDVQRVMARYRQDKADREQLRIVLEIKNEEIAPIFDRRKRQMEIGEQVQQDCRLFGTSVWMRVDDMLERQDPAKVIFTVDQ